MNCGHSVAVHQPFIPAQMQTQARTQTQRKWQDFKNTHTQPPRTESRGVPNPNPLFSSKIGQGESKVQNTTGASRLMQPFNKLLWNIQKLADPLCRLSSFYSSLRSLNSDIGVRTWWRILDTPTFSIDLCGFRRHASLMSRSPRNKKRWPSSFISRQRSLNHQFFLADHVTRTRLLRLRHHQETYSLSRSSVSDSIRSILSKKAITFDDFTYDVNSKPMSLNSSKIS
jgi:hypothetical protein